MPSPIKKEEGFTVRELRELLASVPDVDGEGNEMADVITLGKADSQDDVLLVPEFWANVMEDLETLDDFIADD